MAPYRIISGLVAAFALTTFVHCSNKSSSRAANNGKTCSGTQALQSTGLRGSSMEPKVLALTFDDGPGPRTKALSRYLKDEGIRAAFFVNGRSMGADAAGDPPAARRRRPPRRQPHRDASVADGDATATARPTDAEVVQELTETDSKIEPFIPSKRFLFRPPFGDYDEHDLRHALESADGQVRRAGPLGRR